MCGIFGCVGNNNVSSFLIDGLKRLEYRGYDSAGLCIQKSDSSFEILKSSNSNYPVAVLEKLVNSSKISGNLGIGHTRWATHGVVNNENTHPHLSFTKSVSLVHNGIVENYDDLKKFLLRNNVPIQSQTDSEIIAHLIDLKLNCKLDIEKALLSTLKMLEGINSVALMSKTFPDKIYAFSSDSSGGLIIGENKYNKFISSDSYALESFSDFINFTDKDELIVISRNSVKIINDLNSSRIPKKINVSKKPEVQKDLNGNYETNFILEKEIFEQNTILSNLINKRIFQNIEDKFPEINKHKLLNSRKFIFSGMGSSYNAAHYGSLLFEEILNIESKLEFSSELKNKKIIDPKGTTLFAITQSGETADTIEAIKNCKNQGVNVIAIVEEANSKAAKISDSYLLLETGKEISVAATKTFSSTLIICLSLCIQIANLLNINSNEIVKLLKAFATLNENISKVLACCDYNYQDVSEYILNSKNVFLIGKNLTYPIVREGSLKFQEISKINSNAFVEGELKHGPNALLERKSLVFSVIGPDDNIKKSINTLREINSRHADIITISFCANDEIAELSKYNFLIESDNPYLFPILAVLPLQKLSFLSAVKSGLDPDRPKNLAKTVTVE